MSYRFNPNEGLIVIPVRLYGPDGDAIVHLALDTGATGSLINWDVVVMLGYDPAVSRDRVHITTGSGVEFAPRIRHLKIEALGRILKGFQILCHTFPPSANVDGLLGLDFFRGTDLRIDFVAGSIYVR